MYRVRRLMTVQDWSVRIGEPARAHHPLLIDETQQYLIAGEPHGEIAKHDYDTTGSPDSRYIPILLRPWQSGLIVVLQAVLTSEAGYVNIDIEESGSSIATHTIRLDSGQLDVVTSVPGTRAEWGRQRWIGAGTAGMQSPSGSGYGMLQWTPSNAYRRCTLVISGSSLAVGGVWVRQVCSDSALA